jgi:hypothetical protein
MKNSTHDPRIDDYIANLPDWQQAICATARRLIHAADPAIEETIKRTTWPFFVLRGNVCALRASKDHVSIVLYDPIAPDPENIVNSGQGNLTARSISIGQHASINESALLNLFKAIIANNKAGGWRVVSGHSKRS